MKCRRRGWVMLVAAGMALLPAAGRAWNDEGHMLVAQIAWERLEPRTRTRIERLLAVNSRPESATFVTAACWADDLKRRGDHSFDKWHYVDLPFSPDGTPLPSGLDRENLLAALNTCVRTLKDPRADAADRADMLRLLIHLVGDCHQPLHCVSRYTRAHPTGDRGGNDFPVHAGYARNLHYLWDAGLGLFREPPRRPLSGADADALSQAAAQMAHDFPPTRAAGWNARDFRTWAQDGLRTARTVVYDLPEGAAPPESYVERGQRVARQRIALAGYRLADLLNRLYGREPEAGGKKQGVGSKKQEAGSKKTGGRAASPSDLLASYFLLLTTNC